MKTVSVVMATYNGEKYLREQLDSILNQTYPIHEIIIQDDCSTDGTVAIVEEYAKKNPLIKLFVNDSYLGFCLNFKTACMRASCDFVAISDQDDIWFPEKIETQVNTIGEHDICCSLFLRGATPETSKPFEIKFNFERQLFCRIYGHTMLCKRMFIQNEKNWLPSIWYDWSLALHAYLNNGVIGIDKPLNWHRYHEEQISVYFKDDWTPNALSPYIKGYAKYHQLQQEHNWQFIYHYLYQQTQGRFPLVNKICSLLLKHDDLSLLRLCWLCHKHRDKIYPNNHIHGVMGHIRAFFFPFIHAYFTTAQYRDLTKD